MILTVVGNADPVRVSDLARRVLPKEGGPVIPRDYGQEPEAVAQREARLSMEVSSPQFLTGFKCRPIPEGEGQLRAMVLGDMACDLLFGESSPLYQRLYSQGLINSSFGGDFDLLPGAAYLYAGGESKAPAPWPPPSRRRRTAWSGRAWTTASSSGPSGPTSAPASGG